MLTERERERLCQGSIFLPASVQKLGSKLQSWFDGAGGPLPWSRGTRQGARKLLVKIAASCNKIPQSNMQAGNQSPTQCPDDDDDAQLKPMSSKGDIHR